MGGFEKIELNKAIKKTQKVIAHKEKQLVMTVKRKQNRKYLVLALVILILLGVIGFFAIGLPAVATYKSGIKMYREAKVLEDAVKKENIALASDELGKTKADLTETQNNLHKMFILNFIPIANWYYGDANHLLNAGASGLGTASILIESLKPYADVLGLKGQGSFVSGSAEERIKTAVMTAGKITPRIDDIANSLISVKSEIDKVNPSHYPALLFGSKVNSQISQLKNLTDTGIEFVNDARPLIKVLPALLGETSPKKYLVLFQNDKELRATGGFITAYSIFDIDKGVIRAEKSDDIYTLDDSIPNKPAAPAPILKYLPKVYTFNLRDSNLSPDFIESMKTFRSMYNRAGEKVNVDGIIAIDTSVLVSTIKILDDNISAGGLTFTTKNDVNCNCPQVIYSLEDNISRPVNYIKTERKGLLGQLLYAIMQKALSSSPKIYWGPLFQSMLMQTNQKHILFYLFDDNAQQGVEALNAAGRIKPFDGDYLHINEVNFAGAKTNLFIQENVTTDYTVASDGTVQKTITINYKDPYPPSDCNLERGRLCLNAEYRDWIRVYVPKGSELVDSKGSQVKVTSYDNLGKTVFDGFLTVRPQGIATYTLTYKLPFKLTSNSPLPLLIQKQPGTDGMQYTITSKGRILDTFNLYADKEEKLRLPR